MNLAVVALAVGVCTAGGAGCAANLAAGAAAHLIFCACDLVAAGTARRAVDTERRLINVTGQRMGWATRAAAGDAERPVGDEAARLVIGTGTVPAVLSFGQTFITDPGAIYRACFEGMFSTAPTRATCTRLDACLADQMRCALTAAYLR